MSIDVAWDTITTGEDGKILGESIRDFIHTKFQQIELPRFINSVHVHSFDFGKIAPEIEIKDICDPLPDFYEDDDDDEEDEGGYAADHDHVSRADHTYTSHSSRTEEPRTGGSGAFNNNFPGPSTRGDATYEPARALTASLHARLNTNIDRNGSTDTQGSVFPRSGTPGISGATSNLSYFQLHGGGFSGTQTPLAALAGGTPFSPAWQHDFSQQSLLTPTESHENESVTHHTRSDSISTPEAASPFDPSTPNSRPVDYFPPAGKVGEDLHLDDASMRSTLRDEIGNPSDLQIVARVNYQGDVRLTLTAEILVDYPMPSFVGIPLKLSVTGMKFDGIAIIAYIKKRMHFCFLDPEDAQTLVGDQILNDDQNEGNGESNVKSNFGGLLHEVQIESEIGRQGSGKQVLKNVGKVEKFVLEQVKKIFEEEVVFPSFWTFLI